MKKQKVNINIKTEIFQLGGKMPEEDSPSFEEMLNSDPHTFDEVGDITEFFTEGQLIDSPLRVELVYAESEDSGMKGTLTSIGFARNEPHIITMTRGGFVRAGMVFEAGARHISVYHSPLSDFDICVRGIKVQNDFLECGKMEISYLIEIHGAQTERCHMTIHARPAENLF